MSEDSLAEDIEELLMPPLRDFFQSSVDLELMLESGEFGAAEVDPEAFNNFVVNSLLRLNAAAIRIAKEVDSLGER